MRQLWKAIAALTLLCIPFADAQQTTPDSLPGCIYNATPPTLSDRQTVPWQCDVNGKLITSGGGGGGGSGTVISVATTSPITGGTFTTSGTIACATCTTNASALTLNALAIGAGGQALGVTTTGNGVLTALGINVGSAGAFIIFNGAGGTPSSIDLSNGINLPISNGVSGLATGMATFLGTPSSANLAATITDETGSGALAFATRPTMTFTGTGLTLQDGSDNTKQAQFAMSGITTATTRTYTLPDVSAALATIGALTQTFTGTTTFSGTLNSSSTVNIGTSTGTFSASVGAGATTNGSTKTINIGTAGVSGSTTNINFGSAVAGATNTFTFGTKTFALAGNFSTTGTGAEVLAMPSASNTYTFPLTTSTLLSTAGAVLQASPASPTNTSSASAVMMGLGSTCTITPTNSTRINVQFYGTVYNSTLGDGSQMQVRYGTGAAPANGAAATGTTLGPNQTATSALASQFAPITNGGDITGLTPGTAYWLDVTLNTVTGGTANLVNVGCTAHEI